MFVIIVVLQWIFLFFLKKKKLVRVLFDWWHRFRSAIMQRLTVEEI